MGFLGLELDIEELIIFFQEKLDGLDDHAKQCLDAGDGMAEIIRGAMVSEAPFKWGDLREGHVVQEIGEWIRRIFSDVPHFDWVVGGTYAHDIWASGWVGGSYLGVTKYGKTGTGKQALWWPDAPHPYTHVHHPGTKPNDYPLRALENAKPEIESRVTELIDWVARS